MRKYVIIDEHMITLKLSDLQLNSQLAKFLVAILSYSHFSQPHFNCLCHPEFREKYEFDLLSEGSKKITKKLPDPEYIRWLVKGELSNRISVEDFEVLKEYTIYYPHLFLKQQHQSSIDYTKFQLIHYQMLTLIIYPEK